MKMLPLLKLFSLSKMNTTTAVLILAYSSLIKKSWTSGKVWRNHLKFRLYSSNIIAGSAKSCYLMIMTYTTTDLSWRTSIKDSREESNPRIHTAWRNLNLKNKQNYLNASLCSLGTKIGWKLAFNLVWTQMINTKAGSTSYIVNAGSDSVSTPYLDQTAHAHTNLLLHSSSKLWKNWLLNLKSL